MSETASHPRIVLASASPRRQAILRRLGFTFEVLVPCVDEESVTCSSPRELALKLAYAKLQDVAERAQDSIIIACDTIVALGNRTLGKPRDARQAHAMLRALSGQTHRVITAVAVKATPSSVLLDAAETKVRFRPLSDDEIAEYVASGEPMDKAGAYAIQGQAARFIDSVDGDYWNVVGLPAAKLLDMLGHFMDVSPYRVLLPSLRPEDI